MIEFILGVCVGYFCRPLVAVVINLIADMWKRYQKNRKSTEPEVLPEKDSDHTTPPSDRVLFHKEITVTPGKPTTKHDINLSSSPNTTGGSSATPKS